MLVEKPNILKGADIITRIRNISSIIINNSVSSVVVTLFKVYNRSNNDHRVHAIGPAKQHYIPHFQRKGRHSCIRTTAASNCSRTQPPSKHGRRSYLQSLRLLDDASVFFISPKSPTYEGLAPAVSDCVAKEGELCVAQHIQVALDATLSGGVQLCVNTLVCTVLSVQLIHISTIPLITIQYNTIQYNIVYFQHRTQLHHNSHFYRTLGWLERGWTGE